MTAEAGSTFCDHAFASASLSADHPAASGVVVSKAAPGKLSTIADGSACAAVMPKLMQRQRNATTKIRRLVRPAGS
jgi:hypothetical protein